jgi:isopenicillin N synthase-like dioxygenase
MPWPDEVLHPSVTGFRHVIEAYCTALQGLCLRLLPIYAVALSLPSDYFQDAFVEAMYRFRLSQYAETPCGDYGINPHVDTSFFTLLATSGEGLVVQGKSHEWVRVPHMEGAFVVNFGAILAHVTNDTWPATRHYAIHRPPATATATAPTTSSSGSINITKDSYDELDDGDDEDGDGDGSRSKSQARSQDTQRMQYRYSLPFFFNATPTHVMQVAPSCCSPSRPARHLPVSYLEGQGVVQGE